jgi:hypothetical protein
MVKFDVDDVLLGTRESNSQVTQVLGELSSGSLNGDLASLDVDLDCSSAKQSVSQLLLQTSVYPLPVFPPKPIWRNRREWNRLTYLPPEWSMTLESRCNAFCRRGMCCVCVYNGRSESSTAL